MQVRMVGRIVLLVISLMGLGAMTLSPLDAAEPARKWVNDPFHPGVRNTIRPRQKAPQSVELNIQGVWKSGDRYKAMIADEIVEEGSVISGYTVWKIFPTHIVVRSRAGVLRQVNFEE